MENSKDTWVVKLVDPGTGEKELRTLEWLLHRKYIPLMVNASQTLSKSSSRGFVHTLAQSRSIQGYTGGRLLDTGRKLKICGPRIYQQWSPSGSITRLLPNESVIFLLQGSSETEPWQDLSIERVVEASKVSPAKISFKSYILSLPSAIYESTIGSEYIQPSSADSHLDIVLGDSSFQAIAVLRLAPENRLITACIREGDLLCLHNAVISSQSHEFVSKRTGLISELSDSPGVHLKIPLITYAPDTLVMVLSRKIIAKEEQLSSSLNRSVTSTPLDYRFHGPKFTPILLKPSSNSITIAGYVIAVFPRQAPKKGYRRYGFRLQGTQTSDTCDVTVWEDLDSPVSMIASVMPGHLLLLQGLFTVDKGDVVLANIAQDGGKITNLSTLEGIVASLPDLASPQDIHLLELASPISSLSTMLPRDIYGPFVIFDCTVTPVDMSLSTSLHHNVCCRSVGQPDLSRPLHLEPAPMFCKFCNSYITNWKVECSWEYDVEWNVTARSERTASDLTFKASASPSVSNKLLTTTALEFVLLSEVEKDLVAIHRANYPAFGRVCISRHPDGTLYIDQFIPKL